MRLLAGSLCLFAVVALSGARTTATPSSVDFDAEAKRCFGCHEESSIKTTKYVHAPVAMNACTMCHTPHAGPDTATKLTATGDALCFSCHEADDYAGKFEHTRAGKGCAGCHSPHAGKSYTMLLASSTRLCEGCHAKTDHKGVKRSGGDCTTCHDLHGAARDGLLRGGKLAGVCNRDRDVKKPTRVAERW